MHSVPWLFPVKPIDLSDEITEWNGAVENQLNAKACLFLVRYLPIRPSVNRNVNKTISTRRTQLSTDLSNTNFIELSLRLHLSTNELKGTYNLVVYWYSKDTSTTLDNLCTHREIEQNIKQQFVWIICWHVAQCETTGVGVTDSLRTYYIGIQSQDTECTAQ